MDKHIIIFRLTELPGEIEKAEMDVFDAQLRATKARDVLANKEAQLYLDGAIDGKNAEVRAAQLRQMTKMEREEVGQYESLLAEKRIELNRLLNEFRTYRSIARLLELEVV